MTDPELPQGISRFLRLYTGCHRQCIIRPESQQTAGGRLSGDDSHRNRLSMKGCSDESREPAAAMSFAMPMFGNRKAPVSYGGLLLTD